MHERTSVSNTYLAHFEDEYLDARYDTESCHPNNRELFTWIIDHEEIAQQYASHLVESFLAYYTITSIKVTGNLPTNDSDFQTILCLKLKSLPSHQCINPIQQNQVPGIDLACSHRDKAASIARIQSTESW
ncbi:hypothetical protein RF11_16330 [Thelohanellus kitauei]|uniref:Uncharacterized protein n=1 Tax=Thelohanellus kitauei TaxID=669202 RepID=A0A0C2MFE4_THEKT|nr:hypothetical protein RF11_16330 [Thelohanellus kitauei]